MISPETKKLFEEVKTKVRENRARLDGCSAPRHDFQRIEPKLFSKWRCTHCSGEVDASAVVWYQKGLEHAAREKI